MNRLFFIVICLFYPIIALAKKYEDPLQAFVVGALSWLLFASLVFFVRWIIRQSKKGMKSRIPSNHSQMKKEECTEQTNNLNEKTINNNNRYSSSLSAPNERKDYYRDVIEKSNSSSIESSSTLDQIDATIRFCKFCGRNIDSDSIFCPYCGTKIKKRPPMNEISSKDADEQANPQNVVENQESNKIKNEHCYYSSTHNNDYAERDNQSELVKESNTKVTKDIYSIKSVDLGLSVNWGSCNLGSSLDNPTGGLYGWGDSTGQKTSQRLSDYIRMAGGLYCATAQNISGTEDDIAKAKLGKGWVIPTREHWKELLTKCSWREKTILGIDGYLVTGPSGNSIFLSFTGLRNDKRIICNYAGYYWTSEMSNENEGKAFYLYIGQNTVILKNYLYSGMAIRPVKISL